MDGWAEFPHLFLIARKLIRVKQCKIINLKNLDLIQLLSTRLHIQKKNEQKMRS